MIHAALYIVSTLVVLAAIGAGLFLLYLIGLKLLVVGCQCLDAFGRWWEGKPPKKEQD